MRLDRVGAVAIRSDPVRSRQAGCQAGEPHLFDPKGVNTMSYNPDRDEYEHPEYPKKDPNCANEYRDLPDGGYEGRNEETGVVWGENEKFLHR